MKISRFSTFGNQTAKIKLKVYISFTSKTRGYLVLSAFLHMKHLSVQHCAVFISKPVLIEMMDAMIFTHLKWFWT